MGSPLVSGSQKPRCWRKDMACAAEAQGTLERASSTREDLGSASQCWAGRPNCYANTLGLSFGLEWISSARRTMNCRLPRPPPICDPELRALECRRLPVFPLSGPRSTGKSPRARSELPGWLDRVVCQRHGIKATAGSVPATVERSSQGGSGWCRHEESLPVSQVPSSHWLNEFSALQGPSLPGKPHRLLLS